MNRRHFIKSAAIASGLIYVPTRFAKADPGAEAALLNVPPRASGGGGGLTIASVLGYWKFDESSGNAADASGNSRTLTNENTAAFGTGVIGNACIINAAASQDFTLASPGIQPSTSGFSCWAWVFPTSFSSGGSGNGLGVMDNLGSSNGYQLQAVFTTGVPQFSVRSGGTTKTANWGSALTISAWSLLVGTWDGSSVGISVNGGSLVMTGSGAFANATQPFYIGRASNLSTGNFFNGSIDEAGIANAVLNSTQITALYNGGAGQRPNGY